VNAAEGHFTPRSQTDRRAAAGYSSKNEQYAPASGGADGSLLLSDEEIARSVENPLQPFREYLLNKYNKYKDQDVSAADFVQAAAAIGVKSCPGGPVVKTVNARPGAQSGRMVGC